MDNTISQKSSLLLRMRVATSALLLIVSASLTVSASAAIYMQVEGIKGDVQAEGHLEWIEVSSVQWGVGRGISTPTGGAADREASAPSFSEVATAKLTDKTTPLLLGEAVAGEGKLVEIHFVTTSQDTIFVYQTIKLYNCMISSFSQSSGGDRPTESLSLNYTKIEVKYFPQKSDGTAGQAVTFTYDLALGKAN